MTNLRKRWLGLSCLKIGVALFVMFRKKDFEMLGEPKQQAVNANVEAKGDKIIVIGSGIAAMTLVEELKSKSSSAQISVYTKDANFYYSRPYLSHGFGDPEVDEKIFLKSYDDIRALGIDLVEGGEVTSIDPESSMITLSDGRQDSYDKLVLALGSEAFIPPTLVDYRDCFSVLNSLDDFKSLQNRRADLVNSGKKPRWAIIGGGLIGCELASAINRTGDSLNLYHVTDRLMERFLDKGQGDRLLELFVSKGITLCLKSNISSLEKSDDQILFPDGNKFDFVVVATGFRPRTQLALQSGVAIERGIVVDDQFQTNIKGIYSIGDVAQYRGNTHAFIYPIREQAIWLAKYLTGEDSGEYKLPEYSAYPKIDDFEL